MSNDLTIAQFKEALPAGMRKSVNPELVTKINDLLSDPDMHETYREGLLSYTKIMAEGKFKVSGYLDAVKYVSHKLMGKTSIDAFSTTFPEKIQRWTLQQVESKDIASYVTAYNKSKMVGLLMEQTLTPFWVLNQDMYQKALNTQAHLMVSAKSELVRTTAANSILTQLKPPEVKKVELNLGASDDSTIGDLRETTRKLVEQQKAMLAAGVLSVQDIAHNPIIEGELVP